MHTSSTHLLATKKLTPARRDNLEIDEWARTCGRPVSKAQIRTMRKTKRVLRQMKDLEATYAHYRRTIPRSPVIPFLESGKARASSGCPKTKTPTSQ